MTNAATASCQRLLDLAALEVVAGEGVVLAVIS